MELESFKSRNRIHTNHSETFTVNAWDQTPADKSVEQLNFKQYIVQREAPASEYEKKKFCQNPEKWWDRFYSNNKSNFFKDRHWLLQEFPILRKVLLPDAGPVVIVDAGAGVGNTIFPLLEQNSNPALTIHACDYSKKAVEIIRQTDSLKYPALHAHIWNMASYIQHENLPPGIQPNSVDIVLLIFAFSALAPTDWSWAIRNIWTMLKPGGCVLFRDYARNDLTQSRFKEGRWMDENFYLRGDGTRVYYFDKSELECLWTTGISVAFPQFQDSPPHNSSEAVDMVDPHRIAHLADVIPPTSSFKRLYNFEVGKIDLDERMLINRKRKLKMYRNWLQAEFVKPK